MSWNIAKVTSVSELQTVCSVHVAKDVLLDGNGLPKV